MKNKNPDILQITQIKIVLPSKTIELSSDEARKVYEELSKLFEKEKTDLNKFKEEYDKIVPEKEDRYIPYPYPIYIEKWQPVWPRPWDIIWCTTTATPVTFGDPPGSTSSLGNPQNGQTLSINLAQTT